MIELDTIHCIDIFELCRQMEDSSIDMILCDLPYGTTACSWDTVIPFEPMWSAFKRVIKPRGAIVLTGSQPFTSALVMSNPTWFRCEWIWVKSHASNFATAKYQPMKEHESCLVFAEMTPYYRPIRRSRNGTGLQRSKNMVYADNKNREGLGTFNNIIHRHPPSDRLPSSVIKFTNPHVDIYHPTQKPVALFEYLIKTYTQKGDVVFDPCVGSGTTAIAARNTGRHFICGDSSQKYVDIANYRLQNRMAEYQARQNGQPYTVHMFEDE